MGAVADTLGQWALGMVGFALLMAIILPLFWWCSWKYFQIIRRGYRPPFAQAALFVVGFAAFMAGVLPGVTVSARGWVAVAADLVGSFVLGAIAAAGATELLARLLPRRALRRAGPRPTSFLASPAFRVVEVALRLVAGGSVVVALSAFLWWSADLAIHLLTATGTLIALPAVVAYWRRRVTAPTIEQALAQDLRAPVLHLRPFDQDAGVFSWARSAELGRYSAAPRTSSMRTIYPLSLEQYLGTAFAGSVGPMIALGNPVDYLPPEGAARRYLPDGGWQPYLLAAAESAAAIVMQFGPSDNLTWELGEIRKRGWQRKLFIVTAPTTRPGRLVDRLFVGAYTTARRVPTARWSDAVDQLGNAGYPMDGFVIPDHGAVVGFDDRARITCLGDGLVRPTEFVGVIARTLGLPMTATDADDTTLLTIQPDRFGELWALAKRDGWSDRPFKGELRPLATAVLPTEHLVGCLRVGVTATQALTVLVTDQYLHVGHDGTDERCRALLAQFPRSFRAGPDRVRVPRTHIVEPVGSDGSALVIGIVGDSPVRLTVPTVRDGHARLGEWLRER